jgi:hypothetical protein
MADYGSEKRGSFAGSRFGSGSMVIRLLEYFVGKVPAHGLESMPSGRVYFAGSYEDFLPIRVRGERQHRAG